MFRKLITLFCTIVLTISLQAQTYFPEAGELFIDTIVPRIDITVNPDTLAWLYEWDNLESDIEYSATFVFDNGNIKDTIYPVGFRLRGNTSRYSQKKSFKISFNRFTSGGKYYGVEKLNLNGEHNDPSVIRSKICWDIFRKMEIPASRSNHVRVYINGDYYGLYINVEHVDEEFIKTRFTYNDGNLYKCLYPANLNYHGTDPEIYKFEAGARRVYDLKTNKEADDYTDLARFIDVLNNSASGSLPCDLDEVFNTYDYLKIIAADILTGNWDGYIYNQNNFYLYHNTTTGKFEFIPYDYDNTIGIDWLGRDWANRNIYDWAQHGDNYRPLYERLMSNQELRDQYTYYIKQLVTSTIDFDSLQTAIEQRRDMIAPYLMSDPYYPLDYGYTITDFYNSYNQALDGHVAYGLFPYLDTRVNSINNQLENTGMQPVIKYISHHRSSASDLWIRTYTDVNTPPATAKIKYTIEGENTKEQPMFDDGEHNDSDAGDHVYGGLIAGIPEGASITYQVHVNDQNGLTSTMPCEPVFVPGSGSSDVFLYINEFMASNDNTIADEHGDYDDWIEVYNAEDETVWLGDKYLTDNLSAPTKWQMPDAYIGAGEFLLFWADGEPEQGSFHTSFKLSKDGEDIGIFNETQSAIDEYVFGPQNTDISEGRLPNGGPEWVFFQEPSPGASNEADAVAEQNESSGIMVYPNPVYDNFIHFSNEINCKIYDAFGRIVFNGKNIKTIDITSFEHGLYVIQTEEGKRMKLIRQ